MSKRGSREHYDEEFQREAVRLLQTSGKTVPQLAGELGVSSIACASGSKTNSRSAARLRLWGQCAQSLRWSRRTGSCGMSWKRCAASATF